MTRALVCVIEAVVTTEDRGAHHCVVYEGKAAASLRAKGRAPYTEGTIPMVRWSTQRVSALEHPTRTDSGVKG